MTKTECIIARKLVERTDERIRALDETGWDGRYYNYIDDLDNIVEDEALRDVARRLWEDAEYASLDDVINSTMLEAYKILHLDTDRQLADIAHYVSMFRDGFVLPCIYVDAYPNPDSPTDYEVYCNPDVNGGEACIHLPREASRECLNALPSGRRDYLCSLDTKLAEGDELTPGEVDEISYGDYAVRIFIGGDSKDIRFLAFRDMR